MGCREVVASAYVFTFISKGREATRDLKRVVEAGADRGGEPEMLRHTRHDREDQQRVQHLQLPPWPGNAAGAFRTEIRQALVIDDEYAVEHASLVNSGQFLVSLRFQDALRITVGMTPAPEMVVGRPGAHMAKQVHFSGQYPLPSASSYSRVVANWGCDPEPRKQLGAPRLFVMSRGSYPMQSRQRRARQDSLPNTTRVAII